MSKAERKSGVARLRVAVECLITALVAARIRRYADARTWVRYAQRNLDLAGDYLRHSMFP